MADEKQAQKPNLWSIGINLFGSIWTELAGDLINLGRMVLQHAAKQGIYETIDYESTLELRTRDGTIATFRKRKKIHYLQDNIIAFQDYAWGEGTILLNYRTNRGIPVDRYRSGFKTFILLSLREVKNKGDIDEFNIQWDIRRGFLMKDGYWSTDVSQPTKHLKVNIIFPKSRPPMRLSLEESNRKRTVDLGRDIQCQLPDGRWLVSWEKDNPRLYEVYVLRWIW
jgi:hypothetical protein